MNPARQLRPADVRVRAKRIETELPLLVESKTLGSLLPYNLPLDNMSRSGMLLGMGANRKLPFLVNTLLELTVDTHGALLERPVSCLGKIVRMDLGPDRQTRFGVQIVQMDAKDLVAWEKALGLLEEPDERMQLLAAG